MSSAYSKDELYDWKRKRHSADFKAKVALNALKREPTLSQLVRSPASIR